MKTEVYDLVRVEWIDSSSYGGWNPGVKGPSNIVSYGIHLPTDDKSYVALTTSWSEGDHFMDVLSIPKVAIKKLTKIGKARKPTRYR